MNNFDHLKDAISNSISKVESIPEIKIESFDTVKLKEEVIPLLEGARTRLADLEYINENLDGIRNEIIEPVFGVINAKSKYSNVLAILGILFGGIGVILTALAIYRSAEVVSHQRVEEPLSEATAKPSQDKYGVALLQTARLHLVKGEFNQGKAFLARAFEVDPAIDTLETRALDMMYPDFPQVDIPETGYQYGPVSFSDDGRHLAYLNREEVMHFDAESGKAVSLGRHGTSYAHIELSASGRYLVVMGQDASFSLYGMKEGRLLARLALWGEGSDRTSGAVPRAAFSADEEEVAIFHDSTDGAIQFRRTASFDTIAETMPVGRRVYSFLYAPEADRMIVGEHGRVTLRDRLTRAVVRSWPARHQVFSLALSSDGRRLAAGGSREVYVYDLESDELVRRFYACSHNVTRVGFLGGGRFLAWSSPSSQSGLFEVRSGRRIQDFPFGDAMSLSAERELMVVGGRFLDLARLAELEEFDDPGDVLEPTRREEPDDVPPAIKAALGRLDSRANRRLEEKWTLTSGRVAYSTGDGHVFVYRPETELIELFTSKASETEALAFLEGEDRLLRLGISNNGMAGVIEVFDVGSDEKQEKSIDPPKSLALSPDEHLAAVVDGVGRLWLFSLDDVEHPALLLERSDEAREARFSPDGEVLAVRTGERWRKLDVRRLGRERLPGETRYGLRIEGVELRPGRF